MEYINARTVRDRLKAEQQKQNELDKEMAADPAFVAAVTAVNTYFKTLTISGSTTTTIPTANVGLSVPRFVGMFKTMGYFVTNDGTTIRIMLFEPPVSP